MLNPTQLQSDLLGTGDKVRTHFDDSKRLAETFQATGDAEADVEELSRQIQERMEGVSKVAQDHIIESLLTFLNSMTDVTGDGLLVPFQEAEVRPFVDALASFSGLPVVSLPFINAKWAAAWTALFPIAFKLTTPPPGAVQKLTSIAAAPSLFPLVETLYASPQGTEESFASAFANAFFVAAKSTLHTVTYLVPATPSPVPGPPLVVPVL